MWGEGRTNKVTWALDRARIVVRMVRVRAGCMALVVAALGWGGGKVWVESIGLDLCG